MSSLQASGVSVPNVDDPEAFPALAWRLLFHQQPTFQPFRGPPPLRGLHAYHIFKYIRKQRGKQTVIPYHSHHQRTKTFYLILPVLKENKWQKKAKKGPLVTLKFCIWEHESRDVFILFLSRDYAYFIDIYIFLCCLNLCISAIRLKGVISCPTQSFCAFSVLLTWTQCRRGAGLF